MVGKSIEISREGYFDAIPKDRLLKLVCVLSSCSLAGVQSDRWDGPPASAADTPETPPPEPGTIACDQALAERYLCGERSL
jgi:hypothetical protein